MTKEEFMIKHGQHSYDNACPMALEWIESFPDYTAQQLWDICDRRNWMLWYLEKTENNNDPRFRLMACAFVRRTPIGDSKTVWDLLTDKRSRKAIEVAEKFSIGKTSDRELEIASDAARAAAAASDAARVAQCNIIREFFPSI